jgi:hypothetical protein
MGKYIISRNAVSLAAQEEEEAAHPGVYEPPIRNSGLLSGMENVLSVMQSILL